MDSCLLFYQLLGLVFLLPFAHCSFHFIFLFLRRTFRFPSLFIPDCCLATWSLSKDGSSLLYCQGKGKTWNCGSQEDCHCCCTLRCEGRRQIRTLSTCCCHQSQLQRQDWRDSKNLGWWYYGKVFFPFSGGVLDFVLGERLTMVWNLSETYKEVPYFNFLIFSLAPLTFVWWFLLTGSEKYCQDSQESEGLGKIPGSLILKN